MTKSESLSSRRAAATAALGKVPWAESITWICVDQSGQWGTFQMGRPSPEANGAFEFWTAGTGFYGAFQLALPDWPGDWRESLHRVHHSKTGSRVEWVGGKK